MKKYLIISNIIIFYLACGTAPQVTDSPPKPVEDAGVQYLDRVLYDGPIAYEEDSGPVGGRSSSGDLSNAASSGSGGGFSSSGGIGANDSVDDDCGEDTMPGQGHQEHNGKGKGHCHHL